MRHWYTVRYRQRSASGQDTEHEGRTFAQLRNAEHVARSAVRKGTAQFAIVTRHQRGAQSCPVEVFTLSCPVTAGERQKIINMRLGE